MIQARSVRLAAVIVLGGAVALATSACGGPMQAGAAAVVQGQRTTDATVQSQVASFWSVLQKNNLTQGDISDTQRAGIAKAQVNLLVQQAVWQKTADNSGVTVTAADDAKERSLLVAQARASLNGMKFTGSDNEAVTLALAEDQQSSQAVAPSIVPIYAHTEALYEAVFAQQAKKLKLDSSDPDYQAKVQTALTPIVSKAATEVSVKISPRYGSYDPKNWQLAAAQTEWIRPTKAQLAAAAAEQAQQEQQQSQ